MICRRPLERASAPCRAVQSRAPRSGLTPDYVTLVRIAASLSDASTTHEAEVASTLTLLPKQRGRESTGGCQVLLFATFFTRPDGNLGSRSPVSGPCRNHTSPQVREDTRTGNDTRGRRTRPWPGLRPRPAFLGDQGTRPPHPGRRSAIGPRTWAGVPPWNGSAMNASWSDPQTAVHDRLGDGPRGTHAKRVLRWNGRPSPPASIDTGRTSTRGRGTHLTLGHIADRPRRRTQRRARQLTSQAAGSV